MSEVPQNAATLTGPGGIRVLAPDAEPIGLIGLPEQPSNLNGRDRTAASTTC